MAGLAEIIQILRMGRVAGTYRSVPMSTPGSSRRQRPRQFMTTCRPELVKYVHIRLPSVTVSQGTHAESLRYSGTRRKTNTEIRERPQDVRKARNHTAIVTQTLGTPLSRSLERHCATFYAPTRPTRAHPKRSLTCEGGAGMSQRTRTLHSYTRSSLHRFTATHGFNERLMQLYLDATTDACTVDPPAISTLRCVDHRHSGLPKHRTTPTDFPRHPQRS